VGDLQRHLPCCKGEHQPGCDREHHPVDDHFIEKVQIVRVAFEHFDRQRNRNGDRQNQPAPMQEQLN
jgi:hypothetical protein